MIPDFQQLAYEEGQEGFALYEPCPVTYDADWEYPYSLEALRWLGWMCARAHEVRKLQRRLRPYGVTAQDKAIRDLDRAHGLGAHLRVVA